MNTPKHKNGRRLLAMMIAAMLLVCLPVLALAGTYAGSKLSGVNKYIYDTVKAQIKNVADGTESSAEVTIPLWDYDGLTLPEGVVFDTDNSGAKIAVMPVTYGGATEPLKTTFVNNKVSEEVRGYMGAAQTNLMKALGVDLLAVINALRTDCPYELYWATTESSRSLGSVNGSLAKSEGEELYTVTEFYAYGDVMIAFTVDKKFRSGSDFYTVDTTTTAAAHNEIESAVSSIISKYASASDYDKLLGYTKEICDRVSYNNEARDSINSLNNNSDYDPWSLHSVFDSSTTSNPVCEGYTEAFQYLCDRTNFSGNVACYTVTGNLSGGVNGDVGGPHAWNVITIGGKNYIADVTNSDDGQAGHIDGAAQPYDLVLAGVTGSWDGSYTYSHNTATSYGKGVFTYDAETRKLYGEDILTLESTKYVPKTPLTTPSVSVTAETGKLTASWGSVANAQKYTVQLFKDGAASGNPVEVSGTERAFNITAAGAYTVKVTAVAAAGSNYSNSAAGVSAAKTYRAVTWAYNGGSGTDTTEYVVSGSALTKPADPTRTGYSFLGWYNGTTAWNFANTVSSDVTLTANWEAQTVTLTATKPTFADVTYGYAEAAGQTVTITNSGNIAAENVTYNLTGNVAFTVTGGDTAIPAGGSTSVTVTPSAGLGVGTHTAKLTIAGSTGASTTVDLSFTVKPVPLTVTGATVDEKTYDGTTDANVSSVSFGSVALTMGTDYTVSGAAFADANAGTGKTVNFTVTLTGAAATNYTVANSGAASVNTGVINVATVNIPAQTFTYDGTATRTVELAGVNGETVTATLTLTDAGVGDYTFNAANNGYTAALSSANYAIGTAGNVTITALALSAPQNVAVTDKTNTGFTVKWDAVTGATGYEVQLFKNNATVGSAATVTAAQHTFAITEAGSYHATVKATGEATNTTPSGETSTENVTYYDVTYDYDDGATNQTKVLSCGGTALTRPADPTRGGYTFLGWYNGDAAWDFAAAVTQAMTLTAKWEKLPATLTITPLAFEGTYGDAAQPEAKALVITNSGAGAAQIESVDFVGATWLAVTGNASGVPATGTDSSITVQPNTGLAAGTYTATVTVTYDGGKTATADVTFTVNKKTLTVTGASVAAKTYDGTTGATVSDVVFSGLVGNDTVTDYTVSGAAFADAFAGTNKPVTFTVTLGSGAANYTVADNDAATATGDITAADQTISTTASESAPASLARGGNELDLTTLVSTTAKGTPVYTFSDLTGDAATLSGSILTSHETNTGTVTVNVSANAIDVNGDGTPEYNASGSVTIHVNIVDKATDSTSMTVSQESFEFGGTRTPAPVITLNDAAVSGAKLTYTNKTTGAALTDAPTLPGSYTVTATYETNDTIYTARTDFEILQASVAITVNFTSDVSSLVYNGTAQQPAVTVEFTMLRAVLTEGTDYTVSYESNVDAGTGYVVVTPVADSNYAFTETRVPFTIKPATLTVTGATVASKTYDGTTGATVSDVVFSGLVGNDTVTDYTVSDAAFADANAGTGKTVNFTVTLGSGAANYTVADNGAATATGDITEAAQTLTTPHADAASAYSLVRGGSKVNLGTLVSSNAAGAAITFSGLTGDAATLSGSILTSDATKTGSVTVTAHAAAADLNGDNIPEYDAAADAVLTIEVTEKPVVAGGLTVTQGDVLVGTAYDPAVAMADGSALAGGTLTLTYTGSDGVVLAEKPSALGAYAISAKYETATTIYTGSATFKIHNILDGVLVDMAKTAVTYNGEEQKPAVNVTCTVPGITLAEGVDYTVTYANNINASANTATATVKPVEGARYTFDAKQIAFTINPAPLTVEAGTLKVTKAFDGTTAPGTMTGEAALTGLFRNDDVTAAVTAGDYADANAGTGKDVTFSVTISGVMAPNYTLTSKTFVAPVGEITPVETMDVPQSAILAFNDTFAKTYDLNAMLANMSLTGAPVFEVAGYDSALLAGVQAEGGVLTYALKPGMAKPDAPVTTDIAVTVTGLTNVKTLNVTLTLTLTPEPLVMDTTGITLNGKPFGSEPVAYNGQPIAFTGAASIPGYTGEFAYTWFNAAGGEQLTEAPKDAGSYTLRISIPNDPSITAELPVTITPAVITIKGASLGMEVGGTVPALNETSYTVTGLMPGDALTVLPTVAYAAEPNILAPGVVEIVVSGAQASANYTIEYVNGVLNIGGEPILPPAFTAPETDVIISVEAGSQATLTVVSPNADSYQWYINRGSGYVAIEGATSPTYVTTPVNIKNDGFTYYCEATNLAGKANSPVFTLKVFEVPKTGDEATPLAWMSLMLLSAVGIVISRKRRSENR